MSVRWHKDERSGERASRVEAVRGCYEQSWRDTQRARVAFLYVFTPRASVAIWGSSGTEPRYRQDAANGTLCFQHALLMATTLAHRSDGRPEEATSRVLWQEMYSTRCPPTVGWFGWMYRWIRWMYWIWIRWSVRQTAHCASGEVACRCSIRAIVASECVSTDSRYLVHHFRDKYIFRNDVFRGLLSLW